MSERWQPAATREVIHLRARMLRDIRAFFDQRGVLEVETPLLASACTTDPNLDSFETRFREQRLFLNTSPEYCMKRLLAAYGDAVFQICKSFRDGELGPGHNPEFTLLEWYRPGLDYGALMDEVEALLRAALAPWRDVLQAHRVSVRDLMSWNQKRNTRIRVGERLRIYVKG